MSETITSDPLVGAPNPMVYEMEMPKHERSVSYAITSIVGIAVERFSHGAVAMNDFRPAACVADR